MKPAEILIFYKKWGWKIWKKIVAKKSIFNKNKKLSLVKFVCFLLKDILSLLTIDYSLPKF